MSANYKYLANYGEIGKKTNGRSHDKMSFQLCKEAWNGYETYAIRAFLDDGTPMKGVTLTEEMLKTLRDLLNQMML